MQNPKSVENSEDNILSMNKDLGQKLMNSSSKSSVNEKLAKSLSIIGSLDKVNR